MATTSRSWRALGRFDVALVAVVFGAGLRVWRWAADRPLWLDEEMIAMNLRDRGFAALAGHLDNNQSAPLGWLWVQRAVLDLFGTGERTLRAVPLLFGLGTLVVGWLIGRRWLSRVGATAFVGFLAVNEALLRYSAEVKHYSADAFWVLALLGLGGWAADRPGAPGRAVTWWLAAVIGSWFSMGAILAVPGLALVLLGAAWRRGRWAAAWRFALPGSLWLAGFAAHYLLALRHAAGNRYLTDYWARLGYPPAAADLADAVRWVLARPRALSGDPLHLDAGIAGAFWPKVVGLLFWLLVLAGIVVAARRRLTFGLLLAAPVASAFILAWARVVPLTARLALWIVPGLFLAAAWALDTAARAAGASGATRAASGRSGAKPTVKRPESGGNWRGQGLRQAVTTTVYASPLVVLLALVPFGGAAVAGTGHAPDVDDRAAVAWMRGQHRPGDLTLPVGSAMRALQWYDPHGSLLPAQMAVSVPSGADCDPDGLRRATQSYRRVLAYAGTRSSRDSTAHLVLAARLAEIGTIVQTRRFGAGHNVVHVVELHGPSRPTAPTTPGCIVVW